MEKVTLTLEEIYIVGQRTALKRTQCYQNILYFHVSEYLQGVVVLKRKSSEK